MAGRRPLPDETPAAPPWLKGCPPPPRQPRRLDVRQALDADLKQDTAILAAYTHQIRQYAERAATHASPSQQATPHKAILPGCPAQTSAAAGSSPSPEQVISALRAVSLAASRLAGTLRTLRLMGAHETGARQLLLELHTELRRLQEAER